jgi:chemotaxis-related protein WspD
VNHALPQVDLTTPEPGACWRRIGVFGDQSCGELATHIHCRNCPTFSAHGQGLLDRAAPADYLAEWQRRLAASAADNTAFNHSFVLFRVGDEELALPTTFLLEVSEPRPIHRVPHWPNRILSGLVSVRGRLELCISLADVMGIAPGAATRSRINRPRLMLTEHARLRWAFLVDEVSGVHAARTADLEPAPATNRGNTCARGLLRIDDRRVGIIDAERMFNTISEAMK